MITDIASIDHFNQIIHQNSVSIIDYHAHWSGSCKAILPTFDQLSKIYANLKFYKIDVDEHPELTQESGARLYPTFILYRGGTRVQTISGANPECLKTLIKDALRL